MVAPSRLSFCGKCIKSSIYLPHIDLNAKLSVCQRCKRVHEKERQIKCAILSKLLNSRSSPSELKRRKILPQEWGDDFKSAEWGIMSCCWEYFLSLASLRHIHEIIWRTILISNRTTYGIDWKMIGDRNGLCELWTMSYTVNTILWCQLRSRGRR